MSDQECQSYYKPTTPTPFKWKSEVKEQATLISAGTKPTLVSHHTFVSRAILTTSSPKLAVFPQDRQTSEGERAGAHSPAAHRDTGLLPPGSARGAQPHASPTAGDGNSLHTQLLFLGTAALIFHQSFLANPVTIAPERTTAYVHPASRAHAGHPTSWTIATVSLCTGQFTLQGTSGGLQSNLHLQTGLAQIA